MAGSREGNQMTRRMFTLAAIAMFAAAPALVQAGGSDETRLRAQLSGARIDGLTPSGHADFRAGNGRAQLDVQVEDVKVPVGTMLDVYLNNNKIGTIRVEALTLGGELELNSQDGAMVPNVASGSVVVVKMGDRGIVAGVF